MRAHELVEAGRQHVATGRVREAMACFKRAADDPERGAEALSLLARQLTSPVHWTSCVERLRELGTTSYVELGPGKVLEGLIRRIDPRAVVAIAATPDEVRTLAECVA